MNCGWEMKLGVIQKQIKIVTDEMQGRKPPKRHREGLGFAR